MKFLEVAYVRNSRPSCLLSSWTWERRFSIGADDSVWVASRLVDPSGVKYLYPYQLYSRGVDIDEMAALGTIHRRKVPKAIRGVHNGYRPRKKKNKLSKGKVASKG